MTGGRDAAVLGLVGAAIVAAAPWPGSAAIAQDGRPPDGDPLVVSPKLKWEFLRLEEFDAAIELEWRSNVNSRQPLGGSKQRDVEDRAREILELSTTGFMGHPNLLQLDLGARLRVEQVWLDLDTASTRTQTNNLLLDWNISGLILQQSQAPVTIYSRQNTSDVDQQFGGTFENTYRETGARANIRSEVAPTNISIFNRRITQDDTLGGTDFTIDQNSVWADGRVDFGQAQRMSWDLKYDNVDESGDLRTPQSFDRFEANATHSIDFGAEQQNSNRTRLRLFNESGARDFRQILLDNRLRFEHSDTLQSWYDYRFEAVKRSVQEQYTNQGAAHVSHQLFDSLLTFGEAGFNVQNIPNDDFDSNELFANVNSEYTKEVPGGVFEGGLLASIARLEQSERGAAMQVTDSPNVFGADNLITINRRNVVPQSIRITDATGIILYTNGVDYSTMVFPDRAEIRRLAGSAIGPNQPILIDYVIGPTPGGTTVTTGLGVNFRYTLQESFLRGLSVYGSVFRQDEDRTGPLTDQFIDNDFTDLIYGLDYDAWKIYLRAEQQHRDSSLSSFDATRLEGRYTEPLGRGSSLVISALYQDLDRFDENQRTETTTFSGQWSQQVNEQLRFNLLVQYQLIDDRNGFDSQAFEQEFSLNWQFRQANFYAQIRNSFNDTDVDSTGFQRIIVGVRREF